MNKKKIKTPSEAFSSSENPKTTTFALDESIQPEVALVFKRHFGRTPLTQRLDDIDGEARELVRYTDFDNLKEETGDLLATTIMLCEECGWDHKELVRNTLNKIKHRKTQYLSLGRKTKVAILGGAFNPVTRGHVRVAEIVLNTSKTFDEVWFMPAYGHMYNKKMANVKHRLKMCEMAVKNDGRLKVFDYEIKKKLSGETYQTVKLLLEEGFAKNQYDFSMIIGQDNANTFDKWVNHEELERMMRFVIVPRKGYTKIPKGAWYLRPPHIFLQNETTVPCSSTEVREMLNNGSMDKRTSLAPLVNSDVLDYITDKGLYA